jgi:hypothetical protein
MITRVCDARTHAPPRCRGVTAGEWTVSARPYAAACLPTPKRSSFLSSPPRYVAMARMP